MAGCPNTWLRKHGFMACCSNKKCSFRNFSATRKTTIGFSWSVDEMLTNVWLGKNDFRNANISARTCPLSTKIDQVEYTRRSSVCTLQCGRVLIFWQDRILGASPNIFWGLWKFRFWPLDRACSFIIFSFELIYFLANPLVLMKEPL